jgi:hypothetical protein
MSIAKRFIRLCVELELSEQVRHHLLDVLDIHVVSGNICRSSMQGAAMEARDGDTTDCSQVEHRCCLQKGTTALFSSLHIGLIMRGKSLGVHQKRMLQRLKVNK